MNKQDWKKRFKDKHLDNLLDLDWNEDASSKKLGEEGEDFFVIETDDYYQTTYYFDESEANKIENALSRNWDLVDFIKEEETGQYYCIRIKSEDKVITVWTENLIDNTRETDKKILKFRDENDNIDTETLKTLIKTIKENVSTEVSYARGTVVKLLTETELKEKFGEHAKNLFMPVTHLKTDRSHVVL